MNDPNNQQLYRLLTAWHSADDETIERAIRVLEHPEVPLSESEYNRLSRSAELIEAQLKQLVMAIERRCRLSQERK